MKAIPDATSVQLLYSQSVPLFLHMYVISFMRYQELQNFQLKAFEIFFIIFAQVHVRTASFGGKWHIW